MREYDFYFVDDELVDLLDDMVDSFHYSIETPESLLDRIKELLVLKKLEHDTVSARVEGFMEIAEELFKAVVKQGKIKHGEEWSRKDVVREARLRPFSHYHYMMGSREPASNVMTRKDYLNDPSIALAKLEDDVISLATLYRSLLNEKE